MLTQRLRPKVCECLKASHTTGFAAHSFLTLAIRTFSFSKLLRGNTWLPWLRQAQSNLILQAYGSLDSLQLEPWRGEVLFSQVGWENARICFLAGTPAHLQFSETAADTFVHTFSEPCTQWHLLQAGRMLCRLGGLTRQATGSSQQQLCQIPTGDKVGQDGGRFSCVCVCVLCVRMCVCAYM